MDFLEALCGLGAFAVSFYTQGFKTQRIANGPSIFETASGETPLLLSISNLESIFVTGEKCKIEGWLFFCQAEVQIL
jgi:hypothetical protein